jgi:anti-sigma factor RsiW
VADDRAADHAHHDPELIAALLDRDTTATERSSAEARLASCPACAALHADLIALAQAARTLPPPVRSRDFMLTAADAARLTAVPAGEPGVAAARLTGVMTVRPDTAAHATHDTVLVASLADRTLAASDRAAAQTLIDACDRCAELHADLTAIATATRAMPTPARTHDYMLTASQAAQLRGSPWRRFLGALGSPRDALSRPLAIGLTTLGIAGLLVATAPSISMGGAASAGASLAPPAASSEAGAPARGLAGGPAITSTDLTGEGATETAGAQPAALPVAASSPQPDRLGSGVYGQDQPSPATVFAPVTNGSGKGTDTGAAEATPGGPLQGLRDDTAVAPGGASSLSLVSAALLAVGLALFGIRWVARRLGDR